MGRLFCCLCLILSLWLGNGSELSRAEPRSRGNSARLREIGKPPTLSISRINDANTNDIVEPNSRGEAVIRAAILLGRIKFSPGEIDQTYTPNLGKAINAFQSEHGLVATGSMDTATWSALNGAQFEGFPPAIINYVIEKQDVEGKFRRLPHAKGPDAGERLMLLKAKLPALNYESPLQLLGEKFHCSPRLLQALNPRRSFRQAGVSIQIPNVLTPDPPMAASVVVDAATSSVRALDEGGKPLAFYPATLGSRHDPLPLGNWLITKVFWNPTFRYNPNLFWDAENKNVRATLPPGPKSPVGVVWIDLSIEHYGIHGTPEPSRIGLTYSHGCIRLTNWDATELGKIVRPGTPAIFRNGLDK